MSYGHPRYNGLVPVELEPHTSSDLEWIMIPAEAAPLAETQDMNLLLGVVTVCMAQLDDSERFRPKY